jgi:galactokinase
MPASEDCPEVQGGPSIAEAVAAFVQRFGRAPRYAAAAPGRVNLVGEHTDYHGGYVLPMAIDRRAVIVAGRAAGKRSSFWSADLDESAEADLAAPLAPRRGSFANYLLGVADRFQAAGHALPNLDVVVRSGVPIGAGLASSAALEVAFAHLLLEVTGAAMSPLELAVLCRSAEHDFAGTPCGIMDMLCAVQARAGHALLIDCRTNAVRPIPMPPPERLSVLVADTGVRHALAGGAYAALQERCAAAAERHVPAENARTLVAAAALATGDLDALGAVLLDGHAALRDLLGASCPELDCLVETAAGLRRSGVYGARMTGAGMGGCAVVLCAPQAVSGAAAQLARDFRLRFGRPPVTFAVSSAGAAGRIDLPR